MMTSGFYLINKPPDITSAQLVGKIKKKFQLNKIGHTGTLDKFAEGVMILPFGNYTVFAGHFLGMDKSYYAKIQFGKSTDSGDSAGETVEEWNETQIKDYFEKNQDLIRNEIACITSTTEQVAPKISALKVAGKRQSDLFRQGVVFAEKKRSVKIYSLDYFNLDQNGFEMNVSVSSGTYIRKIIIDLAEKLKLPMHISRLVRSSVGSITLDECDLFSGIESGLLQKKELLDLVKIPSFSISAENALLVKTGRYPELEHEFPENDFLLMDSAGNLLAYCNKITENARKFKYWKVFSA